MKRLLICKNCNCKLTYANIKRIRDVDGSTFGCYCRNCVIDAEIKLKSIRFVEEYNNSKIYMKDGKYSPYWGCFYYFHSLEDAKKRIDNVGVAVVRKEMVLWQK